MKKLLSSLLILISFNLASQDIIELWPDAVPDQLESKAKAQSATDGGVTRLSNVKNPLVKVYHPSPIDDNGNAIVVCPGGGYQILAIDLEGSEIAEWLTSIGFTVYVLEYRVPKQNMAALQDVQRALRIARSKTNKEHKVGVLGFSAGGHLSASASTRYNESIYPVQDNSDGLSARPDFTVLIYPAYLDKGENETLSPDIILSEDTPPMFIFMTADDPYAGSSLAMAAALRNNKTSVEFHLLPEGGHGYGLRKRTEAGSTWPSLCQKWLEKQISNH